MSFVPVDQMARVVEKYAAWVVDLFFQQPRVSHKEVMQEIRLFGREVLLQIREF